MSCRCLSAHVVKHSLLWQLQIIVINRCQWLRPASLWSNKRLLCFYDGQIWKFQCYRMSGEAVPRQRKIGNSIENQNI
ncbi:hypothetical protein QE152_g38074 [Popillia japonica]|uniref:Uncharacterized protein n=1 Tax=Popillia japonica TaxID=7064 RepID=A0AAW1I892_POPJA